MNQGHAKSAKKAIVVRGNEQAAVVAYALRRISPVKARYTVTYVDAADRETPTSKAGTIYLDQVDSARARAPKGTHSIHFPLLELTSIWPFTRPNEHNQPDPPEYPVGRFPYRDVFISPCVRQQLPPEDIVRLYVSSDWSPEAWPDLRALFEQEREKLVRRDELCDVRMSDYVLDHFRKFRLFVAPQSPTNALLAELILRLLAAVLPKGSKVAQTSVMASLVTPEHRDALGALAIPIHKRVAEYFDLKWYDRNDVYNYFDREQFRDVEYYRALIAATAERGV